MADLSLVVQTLRDVLRHSDLTPSNQEALQWAISELQTPPSGGPWRIKQSQIVDAEGHVLASVSVTVGDMQDDANRRLILGAPGLLAAAQEAVKELAPGATIQPGHADRIRTILQRALYQAERGSPGPF